MTDDAFTLMENNILEIDSSALANYYAQDFEQIWEKENFDNTGEIRTVPVPLTFSGQSAEARVMFSPGCGLEIDSEIAKRVRAAQRRVRICSLLINSGTLIAELGNLLREGRVAVDGIYDRTQMAQVYVQWQEVPQNRWKIGALKDIIARAGLVGKNSTPYTPTGRHDFMHNKVLLIDDTVITGSYNFSRSAQFNAENILFIESEPLAGYLQRVHRSSEIQIRDVTLCASFSAPRLHASLCYFRAFISPQLRLQYQSDRRLTIMSSKSIRVFKIANASPASIFSARSRSSWSLFITPRFSDSNCPAEWTASAGSVSIFSLSLVVI